MSTTSALRALTRYTPRFAPGHLPAKLAAVAIAAGAATVALPATHAEAASSTAHTYFVSPSGSDANTGTDIAHPFKTLGKVSGGFLHAGDTVLMQGGATFTDKLSVWSSGTATAPITISSYNGTATLTQNCLDLGGDNLIAQNLLVTNCSDDSGIYVYGSNNVLTNLEVTHNIQGIVIDTHAKNTEVEHNNLHDNDRMAPNTPGAFDDYGAIGIVVDGDNTEVAYNTMSNNVAASADFGQDGSAVEIYGGIGTNVHNNLSTNNFVFTELGNSRSANTTFTNNRVSSNLPDGAFLTTRGASDYFGPVAGTVAANNTVQLTGARSTGYICYAGCTANLLTLSNNVLDINGRIGYLEGTLAGSNNVYYRGTMGNLPMLSGDRVANPNLTAAFFSAADMGVTAGVDPTATYVPVLSTGTVTSVLATTKAGNTNSGTSNSGSSNSGNTKAAHHGKHGKHRGDNRHVKKANRAKDGNRHAGGRTN